MDAWMQVVLAADKKPYVLGEHDCLRVACAVVEARTGINHWPEFEGYKTKREALLTIMRVCRTLQDAVTKTLGIEPVMPMLACAGDIVLYRDEIDHLGICMGENVAVLGERGIERIAITDERLVCAWRIECQPQ